MQLTAVQTLYIAFYGRPADASGLAFWGARLDALGGNLGALGAELANENVAEFALIQADKDFGAILASAYTNLFGRSPDASGAAFWQAAYDARLAAGDTPSMARASVVANIATSASADGGSTDAATLAARLDVAQTFTDKVFDNTVYLANLDLGRQLLASVTAANVDAKRDEAAATAFDLVKLPTNAHADVQAMYIAWYGRPADSQGLAFWSLAYGRLDGDITKLAGALGNAAISEYASLHAGQDFPSLLAAVYQNLFNRAPDADGAAFWLSTYTSRVAAGDDAETARLGVIVEVMASVLATGGNAADQATLQARLGVADFFTANLPSGTNYLAALQVGRDFLATVTAANATAKAAEAVTVAGNLGGQTNPGNPPSAPQTQTLSLTANADALTSTATGTVTFSAPLTQADANTLNSGDVLDGRSAQQASLVASVFSNNGLLTVAPSLTGIGTVQLDTSGNGSVALDLSQSTDVQALSLNAANQTTVSGMRAISKVSLTGGAGFVVLDGITTSTLDLSIASAHSGGIYLGDDGSTLKTMSIALDNQQASVTLAGSTSRVLDTLTIDSQGTTGNVLSMYTGTGMAIDVAKLMIIGGADLRLAGGLDGAPGSGSAANIAEFDASAATGDIAANVTNSTTLKILTGSGNDRMLASAGGVATINLGGGDDVLTLQSVGSGSTVDGGAGLDTVVISSANALDGVTVSRFEVLALDTLQGNFDVGTQAWVQTLRIAGDSTVNGTDAVLNNVKNGVAVEVTSAYVKSLQLVYADASDAVVTLAAANATDIDTLTFTDASLAIKIAADGAATQYHIASLNHDSAVAGEVALTLTGTARVVIDKVDGSQPTTIDASGLAGGLDLSLASSGTSISQVTGSAINDHIKVNQLTSSLTLELGAGDDEVTYGSGLAVIGTPTVRINGGAGADTFDLTARGSQPTQFVYGAGDSNYAKGGVREHDLIKNFYASTGSGSDIDQIMVDARAFTAGTVSVTTITNTQFDPSTNAARFDPFFVDGKAIGVFHNSDPASNAGVAVLFEAAASTGSGESTWIAVDLNRDGDLDSESDLVIELLGTESNYLYNGGNASYSQLIQIDPATLVP